MIDGENKGFWLMLVYLDFYFGVVIVYVELFKKLKLGIFIY